MIPNQQRKRAAVIGAGPGGLAAAMLLSGQGYEVDVYEKQPVIGGVLPDWNWVNIDSTGALHF